MRKHRLLSTQTLGRMTLPAVSLLVSAFATSTTQLPRSGASRAACGPCTMHLSSSYTPSRHGMAYCQIMSPPIILHSCNSVFFQWDGTSWKHCIASREGHRAAGLPKKAPFCQRKGDFWALQGFRICMPGGRRPGAHAWAGQPAELASQWDCHWTGHALLLCSRCHMHAQLKSGTHALACLSGCLTLSCLRGSSDPLSCLPSQHVSGIWCDLVCWAAMMHVGSGKAHA